MKKTIGILSSFDVLCGNATYSDSLACTLREKGFNVKRIALPVAMQKRHNKGIIDNLIKEINECDIINIQFEMGLWGDSPMRVSRNVREILKACPKNHTSVEIHRVNSHTYSFFINWKFSLNTFGMKKLFSAFKLAFQTTYATKMLFNSYSKAFKEFDRYNLRVITHTYNDYNTLKIIHGVNSIVHPIMWTENSIKPTEKNDDQISSTEGSAFSIGVFGYVQPRKNYSLALKAFKMLLESGDIPPDSRFKIFGGYHPEAGGYGQTPTSSSWQWGTFPPDLTIKHLDDEIVYLQLTKHVDWIVRADDAEFATNFAAVDIVVIPYTEVGQSGSGITSHAVQFAKKYVMSDTKMTEQHSLLCTEHITSFDVNSVISCVSAIKLAISKKEVARFKGEFSHEKLVNLIAFNE